MIVFLVMWTFKIHSLSNFQTHNIKLTILVVTILYIISHDLIYFITRYFYLWLCCFIVLVDIFLCIICFLQVVFFLFCLFVWVSILIVYSYLRMRNKIPIGRSEHVGGICWLGASLQSDLSGLFVVEPHRTSTLIFPQELISFPEEDTPNPYLRAQVTLPQFESVLGEEGW